MNKSCNKCKNIKPLNEFKGSGSTCKECRRLYMKQWRARNRELYNSYHRDYRAKNREYYDKYWKSRDFKKLAQYEMKRRLSHKVGPILDELLKMDLLLINIKINEN